MTIGINTNLPVGMYRAIHSLSQINQGLQESLSRIQTNNKILRASDDPSGLVKTLELDANINAAQTQMESNQATREELNGADDALTGILTHLQDMRSLVTDWETADAAERADIEATLDTISGMIEDLTTSTEFRGEAVLGADSGAKAIRWGTSAGNTVNVTFADLREANIDLDDDGGPGVDFNAALTGAGSTPDDIRAQIDTAIGLAEGTSRQIGLARDSVIAPHNDLLSVTIDTWVEYRNLLMQTDNVEEAARIARLQAMRQSAMEAIALQNQLVRNSTVDLLG